MRKNKAVMNYIVRKDYVSEFISKYNRWKRDVFYLVNVPREEVIQKYIKDSNVKWMKISGRVKANEIEKAYVLFADIDYKSSSLDVKKAIEEIERVLPFDFTAVFSGSGIHIYIHINETPIEKWSEVEKMFVNYLASKIKEVDTRVKDEARILRVVGTTNTKTGKMVEYVRVAKNVYDIEEVREFLLNVTKKSGEEEETLEVDDELLPIVSESLIKILGESEKWKGKRINLPMGTTLDASRSAIVFYLSNIIFYAFGKTKSHLEYIKKFVKKWINDKRADEIIEKQVMYAYKSDESTKWASSAMEKMILALAMMENEKEKIPMSSAVAVAYRKMLNLKRAFDVYMFKLCAVGEKRCANNDTFEKILTAGVFSAIERLGAISYEKRMKRKRRIVYIMKDGSILTLTLENKKVREINDQIRIIDIDDNQNYNNVVWRESKYIFKSLLRRDNISNSKEWIKRSILNFIQGIILFQTHTTIGPGIVNGNVALRINYVNRLGPNTVMKSWINIDGAINKNKREVVVTIRRFTDFYTGIVNDTGLIKAVSAVHFVMPIPPLSWIESMREDDLFYNKESDTLIIIYRSDDTQSIVNAIDKKLRHIYTFKRIKTEDNEMIEEEKKKKTSIIHSSSSSPYV